MGIMLAALGVLVFTLYFWNLGGGSLREWDEALTAERSREMLVTSDWMTPQFAFQPDFNKPPVYYWLTAATFHVFGINEFSVRLWSVLFGFGCMFFVFLLARSSAGDSRVGGLAVFILATNPHWMNKTREGLLDSGMVLGMLSALWLMRQASAGSENVVPTRTRSWLYGLGGLCVAIGVMIKGPIPFLIFAVPLWERFVSHKRFHSTKNLGFALGIALLFSMPWYITQYLQHGDLFFTRYVSHNLMDRFLTPIDSHRGGPFSYLAWWLQLAPVSCILFSGLLLYVALRDWRDLRASSLAVFILFLMALLSISASKRDLYLTLLYPFAAVVSAELAVKLLGQLRSVLWQRALVGLFLLDSFFLFFRSYDATPDYSRWNKQAGKEISRVAGNGDTIVSLEIPLNTLLFYSGKPIQYVSFSGLSQKLKSLKSNDKSIFFIMKRKDLPKFRSVLHNAEEFEGQACFENKRLLILAIAHITPRSQQTVETGK